MARGLVTAGPVRLEGHSGTIGRMDRPDPSLELDLAIARSRAAEYVPFSPAWDAAMGRVEELEQWASDGDPCGEADPSSDCHGQMASSEADLVRAS